MKKIKKIHFVGIKGVGQTALAIIAKEAGFKVTGSDIEEEFITSECLKKAGIEPIVLEKPKEEIIMQPIEKEENLEILAPIIQEEPKPKKKPKEKTEPIKPKKQSKKKTEKKDDKFFDKIKGHLEKRGIEIIGIEGVGKSELILKIKEKKEEKLLFAYKKKRITDEDLMKAYKKSSDFNLAYKVLSLGETPKKLSGLIEAARSLENIERIE